MSDGALQLVLSAHAFATCLMCGVIWFVQVVHYPLFGSVGREAFHAYETAHQARTTLVVMPLMLVELVTAGALALLVGGALAWAGLAMVGAVWGVTFLVSVPCHARLASGFDERAHRALVSTNWLRTVLWTARSVLALWMLASVPVSAVPVPG